MTDENKRFLNWLADRLEYLYKESPNIDYVLRLRKIANEPSKESHLKRELIPLDFGDLRDFLVKIKHKAGDKQLTINEVAEEVCSMFGSQPKTELVPLDESTTNDIEDLLHKCLDPYVPSIIKDTAQSFRKIAETISGVYGPSKPPELDYDKVRKVLKESNQTVTYGSTFMAKAIVEAFKNGELTK